MLARPQQQRLPLAVPMVATVAADLFAVTVGYLLARIAAQSVLATAGQALLVRPVVFVTVLIWPVVFACFGLYGLRRPTYLKRLTFASLTAVLMVVLFTFVVRTEVPRDFPALLFAICLACLLPGRAAIRWTGGLPISR